jgi:uncharacterized membrane protein YqjE
MTDEVTPGPATGLVRSVVRLGGTLLALVETRVDLLTTELSEDAHRAIQILLWGFVALFAGILGALLAGITVIILLWDTHRVAAAVAVTAVFIIVATVAALLSRKRLREKPRLLDATRSELRRDVAMLRGGEM